MTMATVSQKTKIDEENERESENKTKWTEKKCEKRNKKIKLLSQTM